MSDPSGVPSVEDLLKAHGTYIAGRGLTCVCKCEEVLGESGGRSSIGMSNLHRAHLAAVLSAREALVLAEGRAEAWDEGWNCGSDMDSSERNPYRRANPESEDR